MNIFNGLLFSQYKLHNRCWTWKLGETKVEQIIGIASNRIYFSKNECSSNFRISEQPESISDGNSSDESFGVNFVSTAKFVLVPPKNNDRETDENSANEDDPNPSCLNKYQLLAKISVTV